ncbi:MAG: endolytic transglycosylase MltG [Candidatus Cloacimonetes bacterium]|nr:endolytic transglycosylase MltG [Candidatus Cloacimonadota bacterium]
MKLFGVIILILIFSILFMTIISYFRSYEIEERIINIKEGSNAQQIANILHNNGIIQSRFLFNVYVRLHKIDKHLSYGKYLFRGNLNLKEVSEILTSAKIVLRPVTIPEGLSLRKTCRILANSGFGSYKNFLNVCKDSVFASRLVGFPVRSLEGFLFPETYQIADEASVEYIINVIVSEYFRQTADLDYSTAPLDMYSSLILASIIERESNYLKEMPMVAGVYLNRLEDNHKLQADPTVAYILDEQGKRRKKIYYNDLKIDSPYNTYKYTGLPPTPICSPGKAAIKSAIMPQQTDNYFFFASSGGRHEFSRTYREHLRKQNELKKQNASR